MSDEFYFWLRILDCFLYGGIITGIIYHFRALDIPEWPGFRWGLWLFVASSAYGTAEVMFRGISGGPRILFLSLALGVLFVGCYLKPVRKLLRRTPEDVDG